MDSNRLTPPGRSSAFPLSSILRALLLIAILVGAGYYYARHEDKQEQQKVEESDLDRLVDAIDAMPALRLVVPPDSTLVALETDGTCDVFTIADEMAGAGWYVQPQMSFAGHAPTLHLTISAATAAHVDEAVQALAEGVRRAQAAGPVVVDPGVAELIAALDPNTLTEDDFDGLLAAAGLAGGDGLALPERMAEVNALLFATRDTKGATAYITDPPCPGCRKALAAAGVIRAVWPEGEHDREGLTAWGP